MSDDTMTVVPDWPSRYPPAKLQQILEAAFRGESATDTEAMMRAIGPTRFLLLRVDPGAFEEGAHELVSGWSMVDRDAVFAAMPEALAAGQRALVGAIETKGNHAVLLRIARPDPAEGEDLAFVTMRCELPRGTPRGVRGRRKRRR